MANIWYFLLRQIRNRFCVSAKLGFNDFVFCNSFLFKICFFFFLFVGCWRNFAGRVSERLAEREAARRAMHSTSRVADPDKLTFFQGVFVVAFSAGVTELMIRAGMGLRHRIREFKEGKAGQLAAQFIPRKEEEFKADVKAQVEELVKAQVVKDREEDMKRLRYEWDTWSRQFEQRLMDMTTARDATPPVPKEETHQSIAFASSNRHQN